MGVVERYAEQYTDSVGNHLEVNETIDGLDLGINEREYVHIETGDALATARAILEAAKVDAVIVEGKLPEATIEELSKGSPMQVTVLAEDGMFLNWNLDKECIALVRQVALGQLAIANRIEEYFESEEHAAKVLQERRDKLAIQFGGSRLGYADTFDSTQNAVDYAIELEDKLAAKEQVA